VTSTESSASFLHTDAPVTIKATTPQLAAASYLGQFGELLGLPAEQLANLGLPPSSDINDAPIEYPFLSEKHQFDSVTVAYYQTDLGIPVWEAGGCDPDETVPLPYLERTIHETC
jgi:hypothetical protein